MTLITFSSGYTQCDQDGTYLNVTVHNPTQLSSVYPRLSSLMPTWTHVRKKKMFTTQHFN